MAALGKVCDLAPGPALDDFTTERARSVMRDVEVWSPAGAVRRSTRLFWHRSRLRAVVHAAGSVRGQSRRRCGSRDRGVLSRSAMLDHAPTRQRAPRPAAGEGAQNRRVERGQPQPVTNTSTSA